MERARYDGLADEYDTFQNIGSPYYVAAAGALGRLLGRGTGRCLDLGCGGGHFVPVVCSLRLDGRRVDASEDQLRVARTRLPELHLVAADATALPFADAAFDACYSTFTHTDFDDFAGALAQVLRVLRPGARFVYVGNHPCFVGATRADRAAAAVSRLPARRAMGG